MGDRVVAYGTITETHTGPLLHVPPSGKRVSATFMYMLRIVDGKIADAWHVEDIAGLLAQIKKEPAAAG